MNTITPSRSLPPITLRLSRVALLLLIAAMPCLAPAESPPDGSAKEPSQESPVRAKAGDESESVAEIQRLLPRGQFAEAEKKARDLLARTELNEGSDSLATSRVLDLLGEILIGAGKARDPEANSVVERALKIKRDRLGPRDPEVATTLTTAGKVRFGAGDFMGSRELCSEALSIREQALPADHPDLALSLDCLGVALVRLGEFDRARAVFERALGIQEKALGPEDPALGPTLNHLGIAYACLGDYEKTLQLMKRSIEIQESRFGSNDASLGPPLNNLGRLHMTTGDFAAAGPYLERALKLRVDALGPEHYEVGVTLHNLASLHAALADYARAEAYFQRALRVLEKSAGPSHPEVAAALQDQGVMRVEQGKLDEAIPNLARSVAIQQAVGPENEMTAMAMIRLAGAYRDLGHLDQAGPLYAKALRIQEKVLGPEHPERATGLNGFGSFLLASEKFSESRQALRQALVIREKVFGSDGPEVAETHLRLAAVEWALGHPRDAFEEALRSESSIRRHLLKTSPALSERQALLYKSRLGGGTAMATSVLVSQPETAWTPGAVSRLWEEVVRSRAVVLDEMARRHRNVLELDDPQTAQLSGDLASARSLLSHLALAGPDRDHLDHYGAELLRRQTEVEALERRLAGRSETYRNEKASRIAGFADCVDALPASSALIAYLRFDHFAVPNEGWPGPGGVAHETPYYAVLTIRSGGGNPRLTVLGSAAKIDALVAAWRKEVTRPDSGTKADSSYRVVATELTKKVWDPVAPQVKGARMAFVVPDGSLSLLNFGTLLLPGNRFLVEGETKLHYLSAERDLLRPERSARGAATALVLGGPDFDRPPVASPAVTGMDKASSKVSAVLANGSVYRGAVSSCESFRLLRFAPLPGTTAEVNEVSALLTRRHAAPLGPNEILKLTGREASEQALKSQAPGRLILHVATHGFFLSQNCSSLPENPLLLSGLALSGANERLSDLSGGRSEDGILTAEEVASLDLRSAEWVVLSGCETGAGVIQAGEGVLGLRRAFQIAGAQTLIMSLWSVADVPAQEWIRNLYSSRIAGSSSAEAVRDATLSMIAARRRANVSSHPHSWGAFIASGDWR